MTAIRNRYTLFIIFILSLMGCDQASRSDLTLSLETINPLDVIDTVAQFSNKDVKLIIRNQYKHFGNVKIACGFIVKTEKGPIYYEATGLTPFRISKEYIAQIDKRYESTTNWGWYYLHNLELKRVPRNSTFEDTLTYGVYFMENRELKKITLPILRLKNNEYYYISKPGIGVLNKYLLNNIINIFIKCKLIKKYPQSIRILAS